MQSTATTVQEYISELSPERKEVIEKLRNIINHNLPQEFEEQMQHGMIGRVIPHSIFPAGYHCDPSQPLPFIHLASQKNHIALYHMGIYAQPALVEWFTSEYPKYTSSRLDMGKSCIKRKQSDTIPYDLIAQLVKKTTAQEWITIYTNTIDTRSKQ